VSVRELESVPTLRLGGGVAYLPEQEPLLAQALECRPGAVDRGGEGSGLRSPPPGAIEATPEALVAALRRSQVTLE
jgi:hypothetical protein